MFTRDTSGLGGRVVRRFAPVVAVIATLAGIAGGTATEAGAAYAYWNCNVSGIGNCFPAPQASLDVHCTTWHNGNGTKTWWIAATASSSFTGGYPVSVQYNVYANNRFWTGSGGFTLVQNVNFFYQATVKANTTGFSIQFMTQFALKRNGVSFYSPDGAFIPANHTGHSISIGRDWGGQSGNSCNLE